MDYREYRKKYGNNKPAKAPEEESQGKGIGGYGAYRARQAAGTDTSERRDTLQYGQYAGLRKTKKKKASKDSASGKVVRFAIVALTVLLIGVSSLLLLTDYKIWLPDYVATKLTVEAGRKTLNAGNFLTDKSHTAEFVNEGDFSLSHVGTYKVKLRIDGEKTCTTRLVVNDSVAPVGYPNHITVRVNSTPNASLCVTGISDATEVKISFKTRPDLSQIGNVPVVLVLEDEGGNKTTVESEITVVEDAKILTTLKVIEAGSAIPPVSAFVGTDGDGEYSGDTTLINTSVPGYYTMAVSVMGEVFDVTLVVQDTVAPKGTVSPQVIYNDGDFPPPARFVSDIIDASAVTVSYDTTPVKSGNPPYPVKIRLTDAGGNKTVYDSYCTTANDHEPPVITVLKEQIDFNVGDSAIIWRSGVRVTDNSGDTVEVTLDTTGVNLNFAGTYTAYYVATDAAGNQTRKTVLLNVHDNTVTDFMLNTAVKALADTLVTNNMTDLQKLSAVYNYLSANTLDKLKYVNSSPHDDWKREAYLALTSRHSGDCFAFAATAQAIFRYLGYETLMVHRSEAAQKQSGGTHYWIMINLGTASSPLWYHFDATPMRGDVRIKAYCLTDAQLNAYTKWRNDKLGPNEMYYAFDPSQYPKSASKILVNITLIPSSYYN
ncbi:MAG: hypothetical protein MJ137_05465 [Clostridia bacterium]|nr:hypothetical protein [Clostridia bacterium]